jgi:hypothetical protein
MGNYFTQNVLSDEAFVATALLRLGNVVDLISGENVCLGWFARNSGMVPVNGGGTITQPLLIAESGTPTWFDGMDPVSKDFSPGLTEAEYTWSWVSHPVRMEYTSRWENTGPSRVMSIEESRFRQARKTLANDLAQKAVNGIGGKEPVGLAKAIEGVVPASQIEVVGGINKATYAWWRNQYSEISAGNTFGNNVGLGTSYFAEGILVTMQNFLNCSLGTSTPSVFFTTKAAGENFVRAMAASGNIRYAGKMDESVDPLPHAVSLFGKPVIPSPEIPANCGMWITLNKDTLGGLQNRTAPSEDGGISASELGGVYVGYHPSVNMTVDGPRVASGQHVEWTFFLHSMCLFYENLAQQGRVSSNTAGNFDTF